MSQVVYRNLVNDDPVWGAGRSSFLSDVQAVAQAIQTRLLLFEGEWWSSLNDGLPLWQSILGQGAGNQAQQKIAALITARILGTPFVTSISNVIISFDSVARVFTYTALVLTQFGAVTVTNQPTAPSGALPQ